ncbi:MAG: hypothetical protein EOO61_13070 [Hymenobacter sp.]|nr:MAG: hypothetical protein EOO61_13070 [Hymenobacter sp.]
MTHSLLSLFRFGPQALSLLVPPGISLVTVAQSYATPAIQYVRTDGINANPDNSTNLQGALNAGADGYQVWVVQDTVSNKYDTQNISFMNK